MGLFDNIDKLQDEYKKMQALDELIRLNNLNHDQGMFDKLQEGARYTDEYQPIDEAFAKPALTLGAIYYGLKGDKIYADAFIKAAHETEKMREGGLRSADILADTLGFGAIEAVTGGVGGVVGGSLRGATRVSAEAIGKAAFSKVAQKTLLKNIATPIGTTAKAVSQKLAKNPFDTLARRVPNLSYEKALKDTVFKGSKAAFEMMTQQPEAFMKQDEITGEEYFDIGRQTGEALVFNLIFSKLPIGLGKFGSIPLNKMKINKRLKYFKDKNAKLNGITATELYSGFKEHQRFDVFDFNELKDYKMPSEYIVIEQGTGRIKIKQKNLGEINGQIQKDGSIVIDLKNSKVNPALFVVKTRKGYLLDPMGGSLEEPKEVTEPPTNTQNVKEEIKDYIDEGGSVNKMIDLSNAPDNAKEHFAKRVSKELFGEEDTETFYDFFNKDGGLKKEKEKDFIKYVAQRVVGNNRNGIFITGRMYDTYITKDKKNKSEYNIFSKEAMSYPKKDTNTYKDEGQKIIIKGIGKDQNTEPFKVNNLDANTYRAFEWFAGRKEKARELIEKINEEVNKRIEYRKQLEELRKNLDDLNNQYKQENNKQETKQEENSNTQQEPPQQDSKEQNQNNKEQNKMSDEERMFYNNITNKMIKRIFKNPEKIFDAKFHESAEISFEFSDRIALINFLSALIRRVSNSTKTPLKYISQHILNVEKTEKGYLVKANRVILRKYIKSTNELQRILDETYENRKNTIENLKRDIEKSVNNLDEKYRKYVNNKNLKNKKVREFKNLSKEDVQNYIDGFKIEGVDDSDISIEPLRNNRYNLLIEREAFDFLNNKDSFISNSERSFEIIEERRYSETITGDTQQETFTSANAGEEGAVGVITQDENNVEIINDNAQIIRDRILNSNEERKNKIIENIRENTKKEIEASLEEKPIIKQIADDLKNNSLKEAKDYGLSKEGFNQAKNLAEYYNNINHHIEAEINGLNESGIHFPLLDFRKSEITIRRNEFRDYVKQLRKRGEENPQTIVKVKRNREKGTITIEYYEPYLKDFVREFNNEEIKTTEDIKKTPEGEEVTSHFQKEVSPDTQDANVLRMAKKGEYKLNETPDDYSKLENEKGEVIVKGKKLQEQEIKEQIKEEKRAERVDNEIFKYMFYQTFEYDKTKKKKVKKAKWTLLKKDTVIKNIEKALNRTLEKIKTLEEKINEAKALNKDSGLAKKLEEELKEEKAKYNKLDGWFTKLNDKEKGDKYYDDLSQIYVHRLVKDYATDVKEFLHTKNLIYEYAKEKEINGKVLKKARESLNKLISDINYKLKELKNLEKYRDMSDAYYETIKDYKELLEKKKEYYELLTKDEQALEEFLKEKVLNKQDKLQEITGIWDNYKNGEIDFKEAQAQTEKIYDEIYDSYYFNLNEPLYEEYKKIPLDKVPNVKSALNDLKNELQKQLNGWFGGGSLKDIENTKKQPEKWRFIKESSIIKVDDTSKIYPTTKRPRVVYIEDLEKLDGTLEGVTGIQIKDIIAIRTTLKQDGAKHIETIAHETLHYIDANNEIPNADKLATELKNHPTIQKLVPDIENMSTSEVIPTVLGKLFRDDIIIKNRVFNGLKDEYLDKSITDIINKEIERLDKVIETNKERLEKLKKEENDYKTKIEANEEPKISEYEYNNIVDRRKKSEEEIKLFEKRKEDLLKTKERIEKENIDKNNYKEKLNEEDIELIEKELNKEIKEPKDFQTIKDELDYLRTTAEQLLRDRLKEIEKQQDKAEKIINNHPNNRRIKLLQERIIKLQEEAKKLEKKIAEAEDKKLYGSKVIEESLSPEAKEAFRAYRKKLHNLINSSPEIKGAFFDDIPQEKFFKEQVERKTWVEGSLEVARKRLQDLFDTIETISLFEVFYYTPDRLALEKIAALKSGYEQVVQDATARIYNSFKNEMEKDVGTDARDFDYHLGRALHWGLHHIINSLEEISRDAIYKLKADYMIGEKIVKLAKERGLKFEVDEKTVAEYINKMIDNIAKEKFGSKWSNHYFQYLKDGTKRSKFSGKIPMNSLEVVQMIRKAIPELDELGIDLAGIFDREIAIRRSHQFLKNNTYKFVNHHLSLLNKHFEHTKKYAKYWKDHENQLKRYGSYGNQFGINPELNIANFDYQIKLVDRVSKGQKVIKKYKGLYLVLEDNPDLRVGGQDSVFVGFTAQNFEKGIYTAYFNKDNIVRSKKDGKYYVKLYNYGKEKWIELDTSEIAIRWDKKAKKYKAWVRVPINELEKVKLFGKNNNVIDVKASTMFKKNHYMIFAQDVVQHYRRNQIKIARDNGVFLTKEEYEKLEPKEKNKYIKHTIKDYGEYYVMKKHLHNVLGTAPKNLKTFTKGFGKYQKFVNKYIFRPLLGTIETLRGVVLTYNLASYINSAASSWTTYFVHADSPAKMRIHKAKAKKALQEYKELMQTIYKEHLETGEPLNQLFKKYKLDENEVHYAFKNGLATTLRQSAFETGSYKENKLLKTLRPLFSNEQIFNGLKNWWATPDSKIGQTLGKIFDETEMIPKLALYFDKLENHPKEYAAQSVILAFPNYGMNLHPAMKYVDMFSPYTKYIMQYPKLVMSALKTHPLRLYLVEGMFYGTIAASYNFKQNMTKEEEWFYDNNFLRLGEHAYWNWDSLVPYTLPIHANEYLNLSVWGSTDKLLFPIDVNPFTFTK